jgi:HAD superfamily hydrolase (TIGR01509 family)
MPSSVRPRLICFDLGGVLLRICRSWEEGCRRAGLDLRDAGAFINDPASLHRQHRANCLYQTGAITCQAYFRAMATAVNDLYSPAEIERIHHAWVIEEYPGVRAVIDGVHAAGLRTAALSNTNHAHWLRMRRFPAVNTLQHALASHQMRLAKPDPAMHRAAEESLGVRSSAILFFDDLRENVDAARACGWEAVLVDHTGDTARQIESALRDRSLFGDSAARTIA